MKSNLSELIDEYYASPGFRLLSFMNNGAALILAHKNNYDELVSLGNEYNEVIRSLGSEAGNLVTIEHQKSQEYLRRFFRLFHNYCASLYTIDENYYDFLLGETNGPPYDPDAGHTLVEFRKTPRMIFFFALRNYFTHYRIPSFRIDVSHHRNDDGTRSVSGNFTISKSFFLRELEGMADPKFVPRPAKFVFSRESQHVLAQFIKRETPPDLSINILKQLQLFHTELIATLEQLNNELIAKDKKNYTHSKKLIAEIVRRQAALG